MPITIDCPRCGRRFELADKLAGQQAKCPCGNLLLVTAPATDDKGRPEPLWRVWTADGKVHGPVSKQLLDQAVLAGRLDAAAHVIREGWTGWRPIGAEYPQLNTQPFAPATAQGTPIAQLPPRDFCQRCRIAKSPWALHCPSCGFEDPYVKADMKTRRKEGLWRTYDDFFG